MKPRQPHKAIPEAHFEEEQGQDGFYGPVSHLIKKNPSTNWKNIEGELRPRLFDLKNIQAGQAWLPLLYNANLKVSFFLCPKTPPQSLFRSANGDLLFFCHEGEGEVLTEYGLLNYKASQYILIPKCLSYVFLPKTPSQFLVIESLKSHFRQPDRGLLGRHGLYHSEALKRPCLDQLKQCLASRKLSFHTVIIHHQNQKTKFTYDQELFDVTSWQGDLFPCTLDMQDIMPVMSHRVHLPPSVHTTFKTEEFIICSFLPRPLETDKDALKVPFYHQNTDYDEVLFYHKGDFFSRDGLKAPMLSLHPAGLPHGPHPKASKLIKDKKETKEYAVMLDSKQPLKLEPSNSFEVQDYSKSWSV